MPGAALDAAKHLRLLEFRGGHRGMAQHFTPSADTWLRGAVALLGLVVVGGVALVVMWQRGQQANDVARTPPQPVPFSHKHHVAQLGIDCRYCHASVETSADAGLPGTHVCMTCHSQIWSNAPMLAPVRASLARNRSLAWQRVARVPDYVYFRHDIHVAKGVGCSECHGRIDRMSLTYRAVAFRMDWCLGCHRDPGPRLRPVSAVTDLDWTPPPGGQPSLVAAYHIKSAGDLTHCAVCHR